jgi:hypothetical protein
MLSYTAPVFGASEHKIALLAQAARLRKHLIEAKTLCRELTLDMLNSKEESARDRAKLHKQIKASLLDIHRTEILLELIARSV